MCFGTGWLPHVCDRDDYHVFDGNCFQVIAAEGEQKASRALREAAEVIAESPSALQVKMKVLSR